MRKRTYFGLSIGLMTGFFAGCAGRIPDPQLPMDEVAAAVAVDRNPGVDALRITAKVDYVDGKNDRRVVGQDLVLSARKPMSMRITVSAFDKAISTLVTDGRVFALMDITQNVYLAGLATSENIAQFLPVFLSASDLYRVIHGGYPVEALAEDEGSIQDIVWDEKQGGYRLSLPTRDGDVQEIYYRYPGWEIFRITMRQGDATTYVYEAEDFKSCDGEGEKFHYPGQIVFRLPELDTNVRLRVEKCDQGVSFSDEVFLLLPVDGARVILLDDLGLGGDVPET